MRSKIFTILTCFIIFSAKIFSQSCTTLGQTPQSAFPFCASTIFQQTSVPTCTNNVVLVPSCNDGVTYQDVNPFWYKFTCYQAGTLGFLITPNNLNDDYDWQLFDVTGRNVNDVYTTDINTAKSIVVANNWSGNTGLESSRGYTGITGTKASATSLFICASNPKELGGPAPYMDATTFSQMPNLVVGHNYLLMISHYSGTGQSGYGLSFGGGSAIITDTTQPRIKTASVNCSSNQILVGINKTMQCKSVAANGPVFDFVIHPALPNVQVVSESGINCSSGFDMDSVVIFLSNPLPPGNYQIVPQNGSDGNTLLDICDVPISLSDSFPLTIFPLAPTPLDSITPLTCAPDTLQLIFQKNIQCSSVAMDGSDFIVTGPVPVIVKSAGGNCNNGLSNIINVVLSAPIVNAGIYTITLQKGSDGNTLIDECNEETPAGEFLNFNGYDTVSGDFTYQVSLGCKYDSVQLYHDLKNFVNEFTWVFDGTDTSHLQDPLKVYTNFLDEKNIQLFVSNGVCTDTSSVNIQFDNYLKAMFTGPTFLCPMDIANFTDSSVGNLVGWFWSFGDGNTSIQQNPPPQKYPQTLSRNDVVYPVELVVENNLNCFDTTSNFIKVLYNCYIAVPSAFTPNGDGLNDFLYPLNAYKATNLNFSIYNRLGQLVFHTENWQIKWDGKINGQPQPSGTYVWMLSYTDGDTGQKVFQKGTSVLIR